MKGNNKLTILRKIGITFCAAALCCCLSLSAVLPSWQDEAPTAGATASSNIKEIDGSKIDSHLEDYLSTSTTEKLSDSISDDQILSLIVRGESQSVLESYNSDTAAQNEYTVAEYALTNEGSAVVTGIYKENLSLQSRLSAAGVQYTLGNQYNVLFGGFEILTKAKYFDQVCDALDGKATVIVGEVYAQCETVTETEIVTNTVNVYDTGIFDSSDCDYDGSGVVIAVLDTGLDYTHSAFSVNNFSSSELALELGDVSAKIGQLTASASTAGLTAEDVYINAKIPYAYDYADKDSDVFPINSEHGTHVSGIIVGKNDVITGVAPNAQLAFMKVFSDMQDGAKTSWILAALEDCVELGVDVINMSLGSGAGFSREVDEVNVQEIYDSIAKQGISLVVAAGNNYSATYGSEKNGNLSLTSNPDTGVVGSPSSYDAALSVASISGVETPYLTSSVSGDTPIYLTEASGAGAVTKSFVQEVLTSAGISGDSVTLEYVLVPGVGRSTDYNGVDVKGKIALVKRGSTSFEDKAHVAMEKGAVACIIYNNVSGEISMSVGTTVQSFPVCSISQDDGEMLAAVTGATITVSRSQVAGPFMSNFSSWGPTPSLGIKPEITAHGGDIYSAVPGESYDRLSGTSMAAPNQAGVTALIRQYVKEQYPTKSNTEVTALVNQIMMSTTDIVYNKNGLAYSVRKQGAGLANLKKATSTPAYLRTYDGDKEMDKTKLELGDDPDKTGVYTATFDVVNTGSGALSYDVGAIVITEGISDTLTYKGYTTVTEEGYELSGASVSVSATNGTVSGNTLTVSGGAVAKVTVVITLSQEDKDYLESKIKIGDGDEDVYQYVFENGMYVEGFITLTAKSGTDIDLSVPYLAFYGDWTQAPLFDLDYFATNKDEINDALDTLDKTLPDAYATKPVGGLYLDYIVYLGSYAFIQDPTATKIAADRKYIALSNQNLGTNSSTVHSISTVYAGMLRSAKYMDITIADSVTGEVIYSKTQYNVRKSFNNGGGGIIPASVDVDFEVTDYNLKNNSQYTVTLKGYLDYGDGGADTNANNTFEFPFVVDFQAPVLSDVQFRSEYDKDTKSYKVYADLSVYDNHYSQAAIIGMITENTASDSESPYMLTSFGNYLTALYSDFNSTTTVTYELTDYLDQIKSSYNRNSFIVQLYDYAHNVSTFEVSIPDEIAGITFRQNGDEIDSLDLSLNGTFSLSEILEVRPSESWIPSLNFKSSNENVVRVVNGKLVGVGVGEAVITAKSNANPEITGSITVTVIDDKKYDKTAAESFALTGYKVNKVYYFAASDDRDLGTTEAGVSIDFNSSSYTLSMYPSESVTLEYKLSSYFLPKDIKVEFITNNSYVASVSEDGTIVANHEGITMITARVMSKKYDSDGNWTGDWSSTYFSQTVSITVKDPCSLNGFYLLHYYGAGERVEDEETGEIGYVITLPDDLGITEIYQYAFTNSKYIAKDENDVIDKEDPLHSKPTYIGDDMITKVIIPEGVEVIGAYAFAGLTALKEVVLPSTLKKIQYGAFYNCTSLETISFGENNEGENNLQFINNNAFYNCVKLTGISLDSIVAIGDGAFIHNISLTSLDLPKTAQSIGAQAFYYCTGLTSLRIGADTVKLGAQAFAYCTSLTAIAEINASVIPEGLFLGDTSLSSVTIGADVRVINPYAFAGTNVSVFKVSDKNGYYTTNQTGSYLLTDDGTLAMVAPTQIRVYDLAVTSIGEGALSGNTKITSVYLPQVTAVGNYTFAGCTSLTSVTLGTLTQIGDYAFAGTGISAMPAFSSELKSIGSYAFCQTNVNTVTIPDTVETIGSYAFAGCASVTQITVGNGVVIGDHAFDASTGGLSMVKLTTRGSYDYYGVSSQYSSSLKTLTIGDDVVIGEGAFTGAFSSIDAIFSDESLSVAPTVNLGNHIKIGNYAFYSCNLLEELDLSNVLSVGDYAFSGDRWAVYTALSGSPISSMDDLTSYGAYMDEMYVGGSIFTYAARLTAIDLSAAEAVGAYAFSYSQVADVRFGDKLESIGEGAFYRTQSLETLDVGGVTSVGDYAFYGAEELASVDLSGIEKIGQYAFYGTALTGVAFHDGATIGDYAFADTEIVTAENLGSVVVFGASAFAGSALEGTADLTSAQEIGEFAFANTNITSVVFGDALVSLGENPFAGCVIPAFTNGEGETSFALGENAEVIDGVLYRRTAKGGLELITYPIGREGTIFTVADGTVRIGARAFCQTNLVTVEFVRDVKAVGDRAFYACPALTVVIYKSIAAPILEEQYDPDYLFEVDENGIPNIYRRVSGALEVEYTITKEDGSQEVIKVESLNVVPFKMWNYSNYTNFLYGANFIDLIGEKTLTDHTLIMIRPVNGTGYENFTYSQYFDLVVDGSTAVTDETLAVIAMIEALPEAINITLAHEDAITAALNAYNALTVDQQAIVQGRTGGENYYEKLNSAKNTLDYLKSLENKPSQGGDNNPVEEGSNLTALYVTIGVLAFAVVALIAAIVVLQLLSAKKRAAKSEDGADATEEAEAAEPAEEEKPQDGGEETNN